MKNIKILVAISGGIDSSVAALLLKKNGFYIEGAFIKNWVETKNESCMTYKDLSYSKLICKYLNIKLNILDFSQYYWNNVFMYFLKSYKSNITPNPDILCNKKIKFNLFLNYSIKILKFNYIATGHYSKITYTNNKHYILKKAEDLDKDQTYFLYTLNNEKLKHIIFPLGNYDKNTVKKIAYDNNFPNFYKKESMGICFIGKKHMKNFLELYIDNKPGLIYTNKNKKIGKHNGLLHYTIGQRKGIGIGGKKSYINKPWYIFSKDIKRNRLIVIQKKKLLLTSKIKLKKIHFINKISAFKNIICNSKVRHMNIDIPCTIIKHNFFYIVLFKFPQKSIASGQSIVFYKKNICLGGGVII